jgi:Asp-tRNA(Asn)/Glu-tRNA(Gln) amidotransferase A subunit family amidase
MSAMDVALLLEVVAGPDGFDPRQYNVITKDPDTGTYFATALGMIQNTSPFDCTHHPAMNVPIAKSDGLPIGMMLIGKHYDDDKVLKAAYAIEKAGWYKG